MREPLNLLPPASPYVANISLRLNGLHRWRPGRHSGLTNPGLDVPSWIATTRNSPASSLASAPFIPTTATAMGIYDTSNPLGCNKHVQSPKG